MEESNLRVNSRIPVWIVSFIRELRERERAQGSRKQDDLELQNNKRT